MNPIGIMQGRLSPPSGGRIQSFPVETWRLEFARAQAAGLACIEWIYEAGSDAFNPLGTETGRADMTQLCAQTGVAIWSVCADYYMTEPLVGPNGAPQPHNIEHLQWLLAQAGTLGIKYFVLPFVDASSLKSLPDYSSLLTVLHTVVPIAERTDIELHLETDLPPTRLVEVLQAISHPLVLANYDIGNSASLGHDPIEELTLLGPWLGSVHVKDRLRGGSTVPLGTGAADFPTCFRLIQVAHFTGPLILQPARQPEFNEVELAQRNREFVERQLAMASPEPA
jgi:hexulose-6-phosphate isomerase